MTGVPGDQPAANQPVSQPPSVPSAVSGTPKSAAPAPAGDPGVPGPGYVVKTPWTAYIKPVCWTIVAVYVVLFVFLNRETVTINFVLFTASVPMVYVLLGLTLIGAGLGAGVMVRTRRRAQRRAELAARRAESEKKTNQPGQKR